jgi:hypothetical protein
MYSRYYQNSGFFEPQYETPFTFAHERRSYEERLSARDGDATSGADGAIPSEEGVQEKPQTDGGRERERREREDERQARREREREKFREREREREKERSERSERRERERDRRERDRRRDDRRRASPFGQSGKGGGLLADLDLDSGDIMLLVLLYYLYQESGDIDMLIMLAAIFLFDR